jgi:Spy/CpxP family protein refolding chaperone
MKTVNVGKIAMVIGIVALLGIGVNAFAGWGKGWHRGPGWHRGGWGMENPGYGYNLSDEEIKALEKERQAFYNETESIRQDLYAKDLELRSELAKETPDVQKAARLQTEISKLESQLDQKRVDHLIKMRKLNPNAGRGRGFMGSGGMGYGPRYGGGYCWR